MALRVQQLALAHGLSLKDASAYDLQQREEWPVLTNTMSFEPNEFRLPWVRYRQFWQHMQPSAVDGSSLDRRRWVCRHIPRAVTELLASV